MNQKVRLFHELYSTCFFVCVLYTLQTLLMIEEVSGVIVKKHGEIDF